MKLVIAIIKPHKLEDVIHELDLAGIKLRTVSHVLGSGAALTEIYRGRMETGNLLKKVRLEIGVSNENLEKTLEAIIKGCKTDNVGDGKLFIIDLAECINVRTDERGPSAIGQ